MNIKEFLNALNIVMPGVDEHSLEVNCGDSFIFQENRVWTGNDNFFISYPFNIGMEMAVKAKELYKLVSKMKEEEIEILDDSQNIIIKGGDTEIKMNITENPTFPIRFNKKQKWIPLDEDFWRGVELASMSASTSQLFSNLQVVYIGSTSIIATDKYRVLWYYLEIEEELPEILLETSVVKEMLKIKSSLKELSVEDGYIHFREKEDGLIFSYRSSSTMNDFPVEKIKGLFKERDDSVVEYTFPDVREALELTEILSFEDDESGHDYVQIERKKNNLVFTGRKEFGSVTHKVKLGKDAAFPEEFNVQITPQFLKEVLKQTYNFVIDDNKIIFESDCFSHMISMV